MQRSRWAVVVLLVLVVAGATAGAVWWWGWGSRPIVVGILHSRTGPMAISERSMIDAEVLALEEINAAGGLLGRPVTWVIADGRSDWPTYAAEARRLIREEKVDVIFGCWTSASRKTVKPVVEEERHLLVYPMAYEGLEQSPNIVYVGAAPNQQIIPAVKWAYDTLKARSFFVVGSDYVWPHAVNEIVKDQLKALDCRLAGEAYVFFGSEDVSEAVAAIAAAKPDVVLSTVVGDSNLAFYRELRKAGIRADTTPVISFSIAEDELRKLSPTDTVGHYAAWNYFQSIDHPENVEFVRRFRARYGGDRTTSDVIDAAYNGVRLWGQAVQEHGSAEVDEVRRALLRQSLDAAEGIISVDAENRHTWRPVYIAKIRGDGQLGVVWTTGIPVRPTPYPTSRSPADWDAFLNDLYTRWGGTWANPVRPAAKGKTAPPSTAAL